MPESALLAIAVGSAVGVILLGSVVLLVRRIGRARAELGTDAEHATYTTLHLATLAAGHLRGGLAKGDTARAARHLRALLDCDALIVVGDGRTLAIEGGGESLRPLAEHAAASAVGVGRPQLFRGLRLEDGTARDAVAAPIVVGDRVDGAIVAVATRAGPGLVRATGEVAAWIAVQLESAELDASRAALAEAQLRALRAQISPHFIYNALNAVASFINTDPNQARELVLEFADFTRYSFRRDGDFTTVAEELRSIDSYLQLERARFGSRLAVSLTVAPEVLSTIIPFLSVQPLVENAVRHGLEAKEGGGRITITAADKGAYAVITVEDDGIGIDPSALQDAFAGRPTGDHVGLRNVDARLRQVYGDDHGLVVDTGLGAGTLVTMRVPKARPVRAGVADARLTP